MRAAATIEQFVRAPIGRWIAGRTFVVWCWSEDLGGAAIWGQPTETDFDQMFALVDAYQRDAVTRSVVTDVGRIEAVSATAYAALLEHTRRRLPFYAERVRRHAMVRSGGLLGGLAEGFFPLLGAEHEWQVFESAEQAFGWLDRPDGGTAWRAVERIVDDASHTNPDQQRLRAYLRAHLGDATLGSASRALRVSERTLHRRLQAAGTCFRDELAAARVGAAQRLLIETDIKLETIARRVGCGSQAQFTHLFRRTVGQSPSAFRNRGKLSDPGRREEDE